MDHVERWCQVVVVGPGGAELLRADLRGASRPDMAVVDRLARLQLVARRRGADVVVRDATRDLRALLGLAGLLGQMCRESEHGEDVLGVEEGVEFGDAPVDDLEDL